jgi:hypothetical protein
MPKRGFERSKAVHQPLETQLDIQIGGYSISDTVSEVSQNFGETHHELFSVSLAKKIW